MSARALADAGDVVYASVNVLGTQRVSRAEFLRRIQLGDLLSPAIN